MLVGLGLATARQILNLHDGEITVVNAEDGGTHSAARWALERWKVPLPTISPAPRPVDTRKWFVNKFGMTMIEIPAGSFIMGDDAKDYAKVHRVTLTKPFFVSDCEASEALIRRFAEDDTDPETAKARARLARLAVGDNSCPYASHPAADKAPFGGS